MSNYSHNNSIEKSVENVPYKRQSQQFSKSQSFFSKCHIFDTLGAPLGVTLTIFSQNFLTILIMRKGNSTFYTPLIITM